ncbi:type II toxin-antitoxin system Phd/YefM family antitoxin [Spirochaeta dissipatitropha]
MKTTATDLRTHLARYLDHVLETGESVELERRGRIVRISADAPVSKLSCLKKRDTIIGDPESLLQIDWTDTWSELDADSVS